MTDVTPIQLRYGTPQGRWVIVAAVLGSGIAFLDSTVVNVALPAIAHGLHTGLSGLQWALDAYLLTLGSLLIVGGSLGDLYGRRRMFLTGLVWFTAASVLCGVAPTMRAFIAARALQGVGGALLVPGSLALISASFHDEDRSRAIGAWSGLAGIWTALGPFLGGWLIDAVSWRLVFLINVPLAAVAVWLTTRHVRESRAAQGGTVDYPGAVAVSLGLGAAVYALIEGPAGRGGSTVAVAGILAAAGILTFLFVEMRSSHAMVPLSMFRSLQFAGANATTLAVYAGLGTTLFLLIVQLQGALGYSPLLAGTAFLPATVLMLLLSSRAGALAQRIGPRLPMTVGPIVAATGLALMTRIGRGSTYVADVLPAVLVFGLGLSLTVAPLTSAVLAAVDDERVGVGSAINNAVARIAGLLAVAVVPAAAGLGQALSGAAFQRGFPRAMWFAAGLCVTGGLVAFATIRRARPVVSVPHADIGQGCHPAPCAEVRSVEPAA